jgi:hypothetical protein
MHEQVYAWLLRLYPRGFREEYADEALQLLRDRLNNEQGLARRIRLWLDIVEDLGLSLWREHRRPAVPSSVPAGIPRSAGEPYLHLIKEGMPARYLVTGAVCSTIVFGAISFALGGGALGRSLNAEGVWGSSAGVLESLMALSQQSSNQSDRANTGNIEGTVLAAQSGDPVADAWIAVTALGADGARPPGAPATPPIPDSTTDAAGRFQIGNLPAGSYRLIVMAGGYVRQEYSQTIALGAGQTARNVAIRLVQAAAVSGRVQDSAGRPLAGINVTLLRRGYSATGEASLRRVTTKSTNDLGEYRFYWVTPGRYFVSAQGALGGVLSMDAVSTFEQGVSRGINEVRDNYPQQFFPGFPEEERATAIDAVPGIEVRGIDFTLTRAKGFRIAGRVIDALTGQPPAQMSIGGLGGVRYFRNTKTGAFEFENILPGTHVLTATPSTTIAAVIAPDSSQPTARTTVVVADADVEGVVLSLSRPPLIQGRIRVDGTVQSPFQLGPLRFSLVPRSRDPGSSTIAVSTKADGTFVFGGVSDGTFRVSMPNLPTGFYLKEARLDGADMLNDFMRIASPANLDLLVSSQGGVVDGVVMDEQRRPVGGIQTVLIPSRRERTDLFKRVLSDPNGRFNISGVAPGDYKIFSWAGLEDYAYFDPAVIDQYEAQGQLVQVGELSRQTVELKVIFGVQP